MKFSFTKFQKQVETFLELSHSLQEKISLYKVQEGYIQNLQLKLWVANHVKKQAQTVCLQDNSLIQFTYQFPTLGLDTKVNDNFQQRLTELEQFFPKVVLSDYFKFLVAQNSMVYEVLKNFEQNSPEQNQPEGENDTEINDLFSIFEYLLDLNSSSF